MNIHAQVISTLLRDTAFATLAAFLIVGCTESSGTSNSSDGTVRTSEDGAIDVNAPGVDVKIDPEQGKVDVNVDDEQK